MDQRHYTDKDAKNMTLLPMTAAQMEAQRILANVADLPIGATLTLADRANDGFGGMIVKRSRKSTWVFQRSGYNGRSRWADGLAQALEEIEIYIATGKLAEPDRNGWY